MKKTITDKEKLLKLYGNKHSLTTWKTETFKIRLPKRIFYYLEKISKQIGLTEEDIVGNGIIDEVLKYPSITGIKRKKNGKWDL